MFTALLLIMSSTVFDTYGHKVLTTFCLMNLLFILNKQFLKTVDDCCQVEKCVKVFFTA